MPVSELSELAKAGDYEAFENRCLELLESGRLSLSQLMAPFEQLERAGQAERLATLAQMILETADPAADPRAALALARVALVAGPENKELRDVTVTWYRMAYGECPGFDVILQASGLAAGRPVRSALKLLELCLALKPGDTLISRMDDRVVEVTDIDRENGLFTLRQEGRAVTRPAREVVRDFDRIASDDFRVLRQLRPEELTGLLREDPVAVVIGLIHAHGELIDADLLKRELVPKYITAKEWSRWWTGARNKLKRSPNVIIEGRSPVILSYCAEGQTLEDEVWQAIEGQSDPADWMHTVEGYLREQKSRKEEPREELLRRFRGHVLEYARTVAERRPAEALACGLVLKRLSAKGVPTTDESAALATTILRDAADPALLLKGVEHEGLRELGLEVLQAARPDDWQPFALAWVPYATAGLLDKIATAAIEAGRGDAVQSFIDAGLSDPARHPELLCWLWKGPKKKAALSVPADDELFRLILDTLSALGRTITVEADVVRDFRHRMRAVLSLRNFQKVRTCLQEITEEAAITIRGRLQRLDGIGNAAAHMLELLRDVHPKLWVVVRKRVEPWEDTQTIWTTPAGLAKHLAARDDIVNVKMPENGKRIGEAAAHGDLSENSEYKFALEERDLLRSRLARLNDELSRARTLVVQDVPSDCVGIGSRVSLRCVDDGQERVMTFFGPFDTDVDQGIFSYQAPMSQKLMGCHVGDRVQVTFDGRETEFEVLAFANGLEVGMG